MRAIIEQPTLEMIMHFNKRTNNHIELVKKWYKKLVEEYYSIPLIDINSHDSSKFEEPEYTPYIYLTWNYYCKDQNIPFNISDELQEKMNEATLHHILNNVHHPEYWDSKFDPSMFNSKNRDEVGKTMVDATKMPMSEILHMMADWLGMSEEKGTDPYDWAEKNVNKRWRFTAEQINLIESVLFWYKEIKDAKK